MMREGINSPLFSFALFLLSIAVAGELGARPARDHAVAVGVVVGVE